MAFLAKIAKFNTTNGGDTKVSQILDNNLLAALFVWNVFWNVVGHMAGIC